MPRPTPVAFSVDWNACIRCGACVGVCPQTAGFVSPFDTIAVDAPCGIACMLCEAICPVTAISHVETPDAPPVDPLSVALASGDGASVGVSVTRPAGEAANR